MGKRVQTEAKYWAASLSAFVRFATLVSIARVGEFLRKRVFETIVLTVARFFETRKWKDVIIFKLILLAHNLPDSQTSSEANGISTS